MDKCGYIHFKTILNVINRQMTDEKKNEANINIEPEIL